jgi:Gametolysin peptidase M11
VRRLLIALVLVAPLAVAGVAVSDLGRGAQTILVINATWGPQPYELDAMRRAIFEDSDAYVREVSFGEAYLTGDSTPWLTIRRFDFCDATALSEMALAARQAATAAGYDLTRYSRFVFGFPRGTQCNYAGYGADNNVWMLGTASTRIVQHELGHTFGLNHAWALSCATCRPVEYADPYDVMGRGAGHYNAAEKVLAGWITNVTTARTNGEYVVDQLERKSDLPQAFLVQTARNDYWFDHREPIGRDEIFRGMRIVEGLEVHASPGRADDGSSRYQPGNVLVENLTGNGVDAILPGQTWGEQGSFRVTALAHEGTTVKLRFEWTDRTPPGRTDVVAPTGVVRSRLDVQWDRATDNGSGVSVYEVRLDGKLRARVDATRGQRRASIAKPKKGRHVVTVAAVDRAGNRGKAGATRFTVR